MQRLEERLQAERTPQLAAPASTLVPLPASSSAVGTSRAAAYRVGMSVAEASAKEVSLAHALYHSY